MERRMRRNSHVRCGVGENPEIISNGYLSQSGLSSYEDIYIATTRQKALDKLKNEGGGTVGAGGQQSTGQPGGQGSQGRREQQPQGRGQSSQGSGQTTPTGNRSQGQQQSQSQSNRTDNERNSGGGQRQGNHQQEELDLRKAKNILVGRLMDMSKNWPQAELKTRVSQLLKFDWNGRFNTLDVGQLRHVEEHLKAVNRNNSQAS